MMNITPHVNDPSCDPRAAGADRSSARTGVNTVTFGLRLLWMAVPAMALCSCDSQTSTRAPGSKAAVVARVGTVQLDEQAFRERMARRSTGFTSGQREAALEEWIRQESVYAKACASGFDREPELQARIKQLIIARYRETHLSETSLADISAHDVARAYEDADGAFASAEAVRAGVVLVAASSRMAPDRRATLRERAEAALKEAREASSEAAFSQVVRRYSDDQATRYRGGDSGWLKRSGEGSESVLIDALLRLAQPGDFTGILETSTGYRFAKLLERKPAGRRPLAEVQQMIRHRLQQARREELERQFYEDVRSGLDIWVNRPLLESISAPEKRTDPPALSSMQATPDPVRP